MEGKYKVYNNLPPEIIYVDNSSLKRYISLSELSIREAMKKLNNTIELFQIIVDENNYFLGTLTDGDIRRGLLNGYNLDENVSKCMNVSPILGKIEEQKNNLIKLKEVDRDPLFLPIVDKKLLLKGILIRNSTTDINNALILAGGMGVRLGNLTKNKPKPLLETNGIPILEHCIRKLEDAGISTIDIAINHMSDHIIEFINKKEFKSKIITINESSKLGTIGSLFLVKNKVDFPLLIMNADLVTTLSIPALISFFKTEKADGVITAATYEHKVPFGVLRYNSLGQLESIEEKPTDKNLVAAGVYILNKKIADLLIKEEFLDMPVLVEKAIKQKHNIVVFPVHEKWKDIGRPEDYYDAKDLNE